jgi:rfaE bifunctional protein kinase chain/domain
MTGIDTIETVKIINRKSGNKKIVFVSGNFNILHPGHLRFLRFAKECGEFLVVGVLDDNSPGSAISEKMRLEGIQVITWVDYAFILRESPVAIIEQLKPSIVVKGKEHEERENPEEETLSQYGGKLIFSSGETSFSSIDLIDKEWKRFTKSSIKKPIDYPQRHNFSLTELSEITDRMKSLKVCVIGDIIVDEYITCDALGMSQEDPTIVVTPVAREKYIGGAGIVASHARGLGADVHLFSVVGKDEAQNYTKEKLQLEGVNAHLFQDESRITTLKQRFRARQKTLLRVSHLRQHSISAAISEKMFREISNVIGSIDVVIFADFNYGCLPQTLVDQVSTICEKMRIMMVADSQSSSQISDISRFEKMALVTPTEREARLATRDSKSGLVVLAEKLRKKSGIRNVIITLAEEGLLIHSEKQTKGDWLTDRLPAFNKAPKDVSGAGDSFLACTAMAMAIGTDIWKSAYLGSLAAACQVGRVGNIPLIPDDLKSEINGVNE